MSCKGVTSSFSVSGASLASALAILSVKLSLRRLPTIVTMLYGAAMGGDPLLERNRSPCTSRTREKMQVHELGFREAKRKVSTRRRLPAKAAGDLLKGYFANLEQSRPPHEDGLLCQISQRRSNHLTKLETSPAAAGAA